MSSKPSGSLKAMTAIVTTTLAACALVAGCSRGARAERTPNEAPAPQAANVAAAEETRAAAKLRAKGQQGLDSVLATYDATRRQPASPARDRELAALRSLIDKVAMQRDAHVSRLFWHTDLSAAKVVAAAEKKPILSLRMLGRLDQELSCTNSRFFRIALYSNGALSKFLRETFVLHWSSERPVPVMTVDFGDGRKIERTIAGNSAHYVLDMRGRPVDALPGLYGPTAFRRALEAALPVARDSARLVGEPRTALLQKFHAARVQALQASWQAEISPFAMTPAVLGQPAFGDRLMLAEVRTVTKSGVEFGLARRFQQLAVGAVADTAPFWVAAAKQHAEDGLIDAQSRALIREKKPMDWTSTPQPMAAVALTKAIESLEQKLAADTLLNEYRLHRQVHEWFSAPARAKHDLVSLNEWMYETVFLTPKSDPWLGMAEPMISGLPSDGFVATN